MFSFQMIRFLRYWLSLSSAAYGVNALLSAAPHIRPTRLLLRSTSTDCILQGSKVLLDNGTLMQVISGVPNKNKRNGVVLLFLHGSFHGSWCWEEHFLPHFVRLGYTVFAPDWRGTGGTPAEPGVRKVKIGQHVDDLQCLMRQLPTLLEHQSQSGQHLSDTRPVVIAHSFGGIALMKFMERTNNRSMIKGAITLCSVPPSGNGAMTMRYVRRSLRASWIITTGFALKRCISNASLCRQLFFGGAKAMDENGEVNDFGISDEDISRFQKLFERDSAATIDLVDLSKQLPSIQTDDAGKASFVDESIPPCMVIGASDDYVVDREAVEETARYFGISSPIVVDSPHDVMLGRNWINTASVLGTWLKDTYPDRR